MRESITMGPVGAPGLSGLACSLVARVLDVLELMPPLNRAPDLLTARNWKVRALTSSP